MGKDAQRQKATYPGLVGREQARQWAERLMAEGLAQLEEFGPAAEPLREIGRYLLVRRS